MAHLHLTRERSLGPFVIEGKLTLFIAQNLAVALSWNLWTHFVMLGVEGRDDYEDTLRLSIGFAPVAFWLSFDLPPTSALRRLCAWIARRCDDMDTRVGQGFETSLRVHDGALWWRFFSCDAGWTSTRPRWRDGSWKPFGYRCRIATEILEERQVGVPLMERTYYARARLERVRWGRKWLPRFTDKVITYCELEMCAGEQIPIPGKGTTSYNCDDDAVFSKSVETDSIEQGIGELVTSVLTTRRRRGWADTRGALLKQWAARQGA